MTIKLLKDIVYISDGNYSSKYPRNDEFVTKGIPFIRANNLVDNTVVDYDMLFISQEKHKELKKGHLKTNDVLLTTRGNIGRVSIVPDKYNDANINAQIVLLRCDKNIILPSYLLYCLQSDFCQRQMEKLETGTALKQLPVGRLSDLRINVVPIKEQEKIVKRLCVADSIIRNHKTLLDNLALLVKSRFIEMFGDPKSNKMDWPIKSFDSFAIIDCNMTKSFSKYADYPHIGIDSIEKNTGALIGYRTVREDGVISGKYIFTNEHIIYSKIRPNLNKVALPEFDGLCSADAYPILPKKGICNRVYLAHIMRSRFFLDYILGFSSRTNMPKVNREEVRGFSMPLPPFELQNQFADFVAQVDKSKMAVQQSLKELETLKKSLMQQYFG